MHQQRRIKMKKKRILPLVILFLASVFIYAVCVLPYKLDFRKLEVKLTVVDEFGLPVKEAKIQAIHNHWIPRVPNMPLFLLRDYPQGRITIKRNTDKNGICKLRLYTDATRTTLKIKKDGWDETIMELPEPYNMENLCVSIKNARPRGRDVGWIGVRISWLKAVSSTKWLEKPLEITVVLKKKPDNLTL